MAHELQFRQVDVFGCELLSGNPVALVLDADPLSRPEMLQIAAWTNLSETAFVVQSQMAPYRLRIFTPRDELPFAGHPTLAAAHALRESGLLPVRGERFSQECGAGLVALRSHEDGTFSARAPEVNLEDKSECTADLEKVLNAQDVFVPLKVDVGPNWLVARVERADELYALRPDDLPLAAYSERWGVIGSTVYALDDEESVHVRSFAPRHGIHEDPVCGSGNLAVAAHIRHTGLLDVVGESYTAQQGRAVGHQGRVHIQFEGDEIWLRGTCRTIVSGTITI